MSVFFLFFIFFTVLGFQSGIRLDPDEGLLSTYSYSQHFKKFRLEYMFIQVRLRNMCVKSSSQMI